MKDNLNNFESFIKSSLNGHEAEYSASAWDKLQKAMGGNAAPASDGFESFVKESLEGYETPYSPSAWTAIASLLGRPAVPFYRTKGFVALASVLVFAGVTFLAIPKNDSLTREASKSKGAIAENKAVEENVTITNEQVVTNNDVTVKSNVSNEINETETSIINEDLTNNSLNNGNGLEHNANPPVTPPTGDNEANLADGSSTTGDITPPIDKPEPAKNYSVNFTAVSEVCQNDEIILFPEIIENNLSYEWYINDKKVSDNINLVTTVKESGMQTILLIGKNNEGIEVARNSEVVQVNELPKRTLIHTVNSYSLTNKHSFKLSSDAEEITWTFGDGSSSKDLEAIHQYKKQGKYKLNYSVLNEKGCKADFETDITVKGFYNIRDDHFFSPDGDGSLDFFMPEELKQLDISFEMVIYNRQTKEVFKTNDINNPWNGRDKEGNMVPFGAYVWVINLTNELGIKELYKGTVTKASH